MSLDSMDYDLEPVMTFGTVNGNSIQQQNSLDLDDSFDSQGVSQTIERWKEQRLKKID